MDIFFTSFTCAFLPWVGIGLTGAATLYLFPSERCVARPMEAEQSQVYLCPRCSIDTPHLVLTERNSVFGVVCSHCQTASLVKKDVLQYHQSKWEQELREILGALSKKPEDES